VESWKDHEVANGYLVISLDFELYWGVRDVVSIDSYRNNLLGVRKVIPTLLKIFAEYNIHATFAIVGLLFFEDKNKLLAELPKLLPKYKNISLSPYSNYLSRIGSSERDDPYHYAPSLIKYILLNPQHEIASHSFSHYYCMEEGQNADTFRSDIAAALRVAERFGITLKTFIFPRNQVNLDYVNILGEFGISAFRDNERSWLYAPLITKLPYLHRFLRLIDAYFTIAKPACYSLAEIVKSFPYAIPASRYLRPHSSRFHIFDPLKLHRIQSSMRYAAQNNLVYHLWWHPHNFGINIAENILFLLKILDFFVELNRSYNFQSVTMNELADILLNNG
jgi:peptidoglycan/xylan/chitin deacetylase (PgdA/CDA1 family)